jgi:hypothetical protein
VRFDANGSELKQLTVWIPLDLYRLIRADRINVQRFVNEQFEAYYGNSSSSSPPDREQLAEAARESIARQRMIATEREENLERARTTVQAMRARREAAEARQDAIADALLQVAGDDPPARLARLLPENDPHGDRVDDWEALVRRVSRLCGAEIDSAEVAAGLRAMVAKA